MTTPRWIAVPLTRTHLSRGESQLCTSCPVALALSSATGQRWHVGTTNARNEETGAIWDFPPRVQRLIARIDAEEAVDPCVLRLPRRFLPPSPSPSAREVPAC
jgi:hypothetical protein